MSDISTYNGQTNNNILIYQSLSELKLIESMMGLRPRLKNLRLVFRLFSLMGGLPSIRLK